MAKRAVRVRWLANWRDWLFPVVLSAAAVVVAGVAFAGVGPFGPPPPKDCTTAADSKACERENEVVRLDQRSKDTDTAVRVGTGLFAFAAGYVALRGHLLKQAEHELAQDRQVTERYTKAIEQLGSEDKPDVVLGGIYALERVALDSPNRDMPVIKQVLAAYVRRKAELVWDEERQSYYDDLDDLPRPGAGVQAALTVIGRLHAHSSGRGPLKLGPTALLGVDLSGTDLTDADFADSVLAYAKLSNARLLGARLLGVDFTRADLSAADLAGAHLGRAELYNANLRDADLRGAILYRTKLRGANLCGADLRGANFSRVDLRDTDLRGADLRGTDLTSCGLSDENRKVAIFDDPPAGDAGPASL